MLELGLVHELEDLIAATGAGGVGGFDVLRSTKELSVIDDRGLGVFHGIADV